MVFVQGSLDLKMVVSLVCRVANRKLQVKCFTNVQHIRMNTSFVWLIKADAGCGVKIQDELVSLILELCFETIIIIEIVNNS